MKKKYPGFEKVDAYLIPKKEANQYRRRRKAAKKAALEAMRTFCVRAYADFAGGEDGEAVMGVNDKGEYIAFIHIDPDGVEAIEKAQAEGNLVQMLQKM